MSAAGTNPSNESWHLDRKVPIAFILAIFMQTATAIWWASGIAQRVSATEEKVAVLKIEQSTVEGEVAAQSRQVAVLVEQIASTNRNIERLQVEVKDTNAILREIFAMTSGGK